MGYRDIIEKGARMKKEIMARYGLGVADNPIESPNAMFFSAGYDEGLKNAYQWQPIETAPRDGTYILACRAGYLPAITKWSVDLQTWTTIEPDDMPCQDCWEDYLTMDIKFIPGHWMPLPKPPEDK